MKKSKKRLNPIYWVFQFFGWSGSNFQFVLDSCYH